MDETVPSLLEERIAYYEEIGNDPGSLGRADWAILVLTGILFPAVCLTIGWFVGWPS